MSIWYAIFMLAASYFISAAMAPKIQDPSPEKLSDLDIPQVDDGTPQAVIFGDCWTGDWTVLAVGNYRTEQITKDDGSKI